MAEETQNPKKEVFNTIAMSSAIAFAEWVDWSQYERFEGRKDLWYNKKATYSNPIPVKKTEDLWHEFLNHHMNLSK